MSAIKELLMEEQEKPATESEFDKSIAQQTKALQTQIELFNWFDEQINKEFKNYEI